MLNTARKTGARFQWLCQNVARHPAAHHSHNIAYCVYYGFALLEDHGLKLIIVSGIFIYCVIELVAGPHVPKAELDID